MPDGSTVAKAMYSHEAPALTCQWSAVCICCVVGMALFVFCFEKRILPGKLLRIFQTLSHHALSTLAKQDGSKLASGGADSAGRLFDVTTGQPTQFAKHDAPIKSLRWIDGPNIVATGSWDKTIKVNFNRRWE